MTMDVTMLSTNGIKRYSVSRLTLIVSTKAYASTYRGTITTIIPHHPARHSFRWQILLEQSAVSLSTCWDVISLLMLMALNAGHSPYRDEKLICV